MELSDTEDDLRGVINFSLYSNEDYTSIVFRI